MRWHQSLYIILNLQIDHIKEKLNKITPSMWQCTLKSGLRTAKSESASFLDVVTTCYLSLECPSDFVIATLDGKKNENDALKVNIFYFNRTIQKVEL